VSQWFSTAKRFLYEVWLEAKPEGRVNWPSPRKLMESTMLVMICAVLFMVYIGLIDVIFESLIWYIVETFRV